MPVYDTANSERKMGWSPAVLDPDYLSCHPAAILKMAFKRAVEGKTLPCSKFGSVLSQENPEGQSMGPGFQSREKSLLH